MQFTRKGGIVQDGTYAIYLRKSREDIESEKYCEGETLARYVLIQNVIWC